jgi:hypothetical protein
MKQNEEFIDKDSRLLREIMNLRKQLSELYNHTGPTSPDYIRLSLRLNVLIHEYIERRAKQISFV